MKSLFLVLSLFVSLTCNTVLSQDLRDTSLSINGNTVIVIICSDKNLAEVSKMIENAANQGMKCKCVDCKCSDCKCIECKKCDKCGKCACGPNCTCGLECKKCDCPKDTKCKECDTPKKKETEPKTQGGKILKKLDVPIGDIMKKAQNLFPAQDFREVNGIKTEEAKPEVVEPRIEMPETPKLENEKPMVKITPKTSHKSKMDKRKEFFRKKQEERRKRIYNFFHKNK